MYYVRAKAGFDSQTESQEPKLVHFFVLQKLVFGFDKSEGYWPYLSNGARRVR